MIQFPLQRKVKYQVVISILFLKLVDFMLDIFLLLTVGIFWHLPAFSQQ